MRTQINIGSEQRPQEAFFGEPEEIWATSQLAAPTLNKVTDKVGNNEGGWYEDSETGERLYVKFYDNPDHARVEFVANAVYAKANVNVPKAELREVDGRLAIASREIPGVRAVSLDELKANHEVRDGFVVDAYLANWDVVGVNRRNIEEDKEGIMWRIDQGGSITFRALGQPRIFTPDDIPELHSMLNPDYPAGQVFAGITEAEMTDQAMRLVKNVSVQDIDDIVTDSGLSHEAAQVVRDGLVGRRNFLIRHFSLKEEYFESPETAPLS